MMITATATITATSSRVRPPPPAASADNPPERLTPASPPVSFLLNVGIVSSSAKPLSPFPFLGAPSGDHRVIGRRAALAVDAPLDLHDARDELRFALDGDRPRTWDVDL